MSDLSDPGDDRNSEPLADPAGDVPDDPSLAADFDAEEEEE